MKIRMLRETPPPELAVKLEEFESVFTYPLGPGRSFRISHSPDYTRFYRSMGNAACFVAEQDETVVGTLSIVIRDLFMPDGSSRRAAYIGDLKVRPESRTSRALLQLAKSADDWARPRVTAAFGVVMDGTGALPSEYSGRAGIEPFRAVGQIVVLRLSTDAITSIEIEPALEYDHAPEHIADLTRGSFSVDGRSSTTRSEMKPGWLTASDGSACGRLEDTRRAKRLIANDGIEMVSAHLSGFAYRTGWDGVKLLRQACAKAKTLGMPALFVSVPAANFPALSDAMGNLQKVIATATLYGAGLDIAADWNINTSEI